MYASYMLSVALAIIVSLLYWLIAGFNLWGIIITVSIVLIVAFPFLYRYARTLWLYATIYFDQEVWRRALKNCS